MCPQLRRSALLYFTVCMTLYKTLACPSMTSGEGLAQDRCQDDLNSLRVCERCHPEVKFTAGECRADPLVRQTCVLCQDNPNHCHVIVQLINILTSIGYPNRFDSRQASSTLGGPSFISGLTIDDLGAIFRELVQYISAGNIVQPLLIHAVEKKIIKSNSDTVDGIDVDNSEEITKTQHYKASSSKEIDKRSKIKKDIVHHLHLTSYPHLIIKHGTPDQEYFLRDKEKKVSTLNTSPNHIRDPPISVSRDAISVNKLLGFTNSQQYKSRLISSSERYHQFVSKLLNYGKVKNLTIRKERNKRSKADEKHEIKTTGSDDVIMTQERTVQDDHNDHEVVLYNENYYFNTVNDDDGDGTVKSSNDNSKRDKKWGSLGAGKFRRWWFGQVLD